MPTRRRQNEVMESKISQRIRTILFWMYGAKVVAGLAMIVILLLNLILPGHARPFCKWDGIRYGSYRNVPEEVRKVARQNAKTLDNVPNPDDFANLCCHSDGTDFGAPRWWFYVGLDCEDGNKEKK